MNEHEHGEDDEVQASPGLGQALIAACQPPEAFEPAEAALNHPAAGQQHEALLRPGQLDDLQRKAVLTCGVRSRVARIATVGKCKFHRLTGYMLNLTRKLGHLRIIASTLTTALQQTCLIAGKRPVGCLRRGKSRSSRVRPRSVDGIFCLSAKSTGQRCRRILTTAFLLCKE